MTDITFNDKHGRNRPGFSRSKKHNLRIDMTPMVDLGFLLITFFIFTSKLTEPTVMNLILPDESGVPMPTKQSGAMTLLLGNNKVYCYEGEFDPAKIKETTLAGTRELIAGKKKLISEEDLFVIIKPGKNARYKEIVDVLDEMTISRVKRYALVKIEEKEEGLINK